MCLIFKVFVIAISDVIHSITTFFHVENVDENDQNFFLPIAEPIAGIQMLLFFPCQDVYVERLTKHVEKVSGQITLFEVQITAQSEETKAAKETCSEVGN